MELQEIVESINNLNQKLDESKHYLSEFKKKFNSFIEVFPSNKGTYLVLGIICLAVLIFDFFISEKSLLYLSDIIKIRVFFLALIFTILDGGIAILASGGLAGANLVKANSMKKIWRPILILLAIIKLILFGVLVYNSYYGGDIYGNEIIPLGSWEMVKIIIPQVFFVAITYFVLGKAGFGLYYIVGIAYFGVLKFLLSNPMMFENKLYDKCMEFKQSVGSYNNQPDAVIIEEEIKNFGIQEIYWNIISNNNKGTKNGQN